MSCRPQFAPHRRWTLAVPLLLLVWSGIVQAEETLYLPGEVQVRLRPGASIAALNARYGTATRDSLPPSYLLRLPDSGEEEAWAERLRLDPDVEVAECSWREETPEGVRQMVVIVVGGTIEGYHDQEVLTRLHVPDLRERFTGAGVRVAVLDTGVDPTHEALAGAIEPGGWDFVAGDPDPFDGGDGVDEDGDGTIDEGMGHGTMVAGIIHLLAPDALILPVRVLDDEGRGRVFDVAKGMRHALDSGVDVINLSLGLLQHTFIIQDEILRAAAQSVAIVAAAGNLGMENPPYYPAIDPQTLSVAALDSLDIKAEFSNWHRSVDLSAPGVGILAPYPGGAYALGAGTSFAAPFVSAQCTWILEGTDPASLAELFRLAREGTDDIYAIPENEPYADELGAGRVDGWKTLAAIDQSSAAPEAAAPPAVLRLWPNPSSSGQVVTFRSPGLPEGSRLFLHDVTGRLVDVIACGPDGTARIGWGAAGGRPRPGSMMERRAPLPAGLYFLRVEGWAGAIRLVRLP